MGQGLEDAKAMLRYLMNKRQLEQAQEQKAFIEGGGRLGDGSETPIPGAAAMKRKVDESLTEHVVEPLAKRGYEKLGAAIATVPSVVADVVLPDTVGELAMPPPARGGGKAANKAAAITGEAAEAAGMRRIILKRDPVSGAYDKVSSKLSDAEKYPFLKQFAIEGEGGALQPKWLYHGSGAKAKDLKDGVDPRVGDIVSSSYGEAIEAVESSGGSLTPMVFLNDDPEGIGSYAIWSVAHRLKKDPKEVSWDDLRKHGAVAVKDTAVPGSRYGQDIYRKDPRSHKNSEMGLEKVRKMGSSESVTRLDSGYDSPKVDDLHQVEPGDYFSADQVDADYIIDGADLVDLISRHSKNHWARSIRDKHGMPTAKAKRLKAE